MVEDRSKEVSRIYKKLSRKPEIFFKTQMEYSKYGISSIVAIRAYLAIRDGLSEIEKEDGGK